MKTAIVVLGMHRSGTSALSRALSFGGFAQPGDVMRPQPDNPKGFWEPAEIVRLNEGILKTLQGSWDQPGPWLIRGQTLPEARRSVTAWMRDKFRQPALAAMRDSFGDERAIVLKDPRVSLFLPFWAEVVTDAGYKLYPVLIYRNPLDVAASLRARNGTPTRASFQLWARYTLSALNPENECPVGAVCSYEKLVQQPTKTVGDLLAAISAPGLTAEAEAEITAFIAAADRHHSSSDDAVAEAPLASGILKRTWSVLRRWDTTKARTRAKQIAELCASYDDSVLLGGPLRFLQPSEPAVATLSHARDTAAERPLLLHYHLFKNAGTSVDEMLKRNFGMRWAQAEFEHPARANVREVQAYLESRPELEAFSSHTANLPPPELPGRRVIPILFLRHPLARLKSAYQFERKQQAETFGARLAKEQDFAGYIAALLEAPAHRQARNFQTYRLAFGQPHAKGGELERARATLASLPFVGLVEAYERSLEGLQALLAALLPEFRAVAVRSNATSPEPANLDQALAEIDAELGPELSQSVRDANADDLELFQTVGDSYGYGDEQASDQRDAYA